MTLLFQDRHVVVTGGTGALGTAVVTALLEAGATCHVPYIAEAEASRVPQRDHARRVAAGGGAGFPNGITPASCWWAAATSPTRRRSIGCSGACRRCGPRSIWPAASRS